MVRFGFGFSDVEPGKTGKATSRGFEALNGPPLNSNVVDLYFEGN
jgi:hypothetical protein